MQTNTREIVNDSPAALARLFLGSVLSSLLLAPYICLLFMSSSMALLASGGDGRGPPPIRA